jgi:4'-phosphopantetheinyl transferase
VAEVTQRREREIAIRTRCVHCGADTHGQPYAMHPGGTLPVSIAHSAERVLVATTTATAVGADIELIDEPRFNAQLFDHIEAPHEHTPRMAAAFTRLWVHKEAVLKCTGDGLVVSPRTFSIAFDRDPPSLIGWTGKLASIGLASLDVGRRYAAAVAVGGTCEFKLEMR